MDHAINHCQLVDEARDAQVDTVTFQEQVLERAHQLVLDRTGAGGEKASEPHQLRAIEVAAVAVADHVIQEGARQIASDFRVSLDDLKDHAAAEHISSC